MVFCSQKPEHPRGQGMVVRRRRAGRGRGWVYMVYRVCVCGGEGKLWCFKRRGNLKEDGKENRHLFLLG